jgi:hypothetical protein
MTDSVSPGLTSAAAGSVADGAAGVRAMGLAQEQVAAPVLLQQMKSAGGGAVPVQLDGSGAPAVPEHGTVATCCTTRGPYGVVAPLGITIDVTGLPAPAQLHPGRPAPAVLCEERNGGASWTEYTKGTTSDGRYPVLHATAFTVVLDVNGPRVLDPGTTVPLPLVHVGVVPSVVMWIDTGSSLVTVAVARVGVTPPGDHGVSPGLGLLIVGSPAARS